FSGASSALAEYHRSELVAVKYPNNVNEGNSPVYSKSLVIDGDITSGFVELLPFVIPSPNQEEAGSCLYMATTGNVEWLLAKNNPNLPRKMNGPIDLSERHLMNVAGLDEAGNGVANWKTDSVFLFNWMKGAQLNQNYPYTKGYYTQETDGIHEAKSDTPAAEYGTSYNWLDQHHTITSAPIPLLELTREILFADPESNQWNMGVTPD
ncbi:MAG: hypothetical protein AAB276_02795, partial [Pseudomonadota bacterium]